MAEVPMANRLIHVVDDDEAMRHSLAFLLGSSGFAVSVYEAAQPLLDALNELPPGCILTDIRMPGIDGLELLRRIAASRKQLPVIVMTGHGDVPHAVEAMKLGAVDFIEKPFDDETLLRAIAAAFEQGGAAQFASAELQDFKNRLGTLSQRERQVFDRLVAGDANKVIARHLEISPRTVEIYRANVMTKMQASNVPELVRSAVRAGVT
jgi:two-component system response regulator FixJ